MIFGFHTREARIEGRRTRDLMDRGPVKYTLEMRLKTGRVYSEEAIESHARAVRQRATRAAHLARLAMLTEPKAVKYALLVDGPSAFVPESRLMGA